MERILHSSLSSCRCARAIGGFNEDSGHLNTNEMYDPATNTWTNKTPMPTRRKEFGIAVWQDKIYVIGGVTINSITTAINEVYDPLTDSWENKAPIPTPRQSLSASVVLDRVYLIGGSNSTGYIFNMTEIYDPEADSWTIGQSANYSFHIHGSAVFEHKIYILGGEFGGTNIRRYNQIYDPVNNSWSQGADMLQSVCNLGVGVTLGVMAPKRIYCIGGSIGALERTNITQVYDPQYDIWTLGTPMPTVRYQLAVAVVYDAIYAIGGFDPDYNASTTNEQYFPIGYIPEFPSFFVLPLFMIATLLVIIIFKRKHKLISTRYS